MLTRMKHQYLVSVIDYFIEGNNSYFAMEFVVGESLADRIHPRHQAAGCRHRDRRGCGVGDPARGEGRADAQGPRARECGDDQGPAGDDAAGPIETFWGSANPKSLSGPAGRTGKSSRARHEEPRRLAPQGTPHGIVERQSGEDNPPPRAAPPAPPSEYNKETTPQLAPCVTNLVASTLVKTEKMNYTRVPLG